MNPEEPNLYEAMISDEKSYGYGWKAGKWAEQQRIIKILKADEWHDIAFAARGADDEPTEYHDGECLGCRQIALIKGETGLPDYHCPECKDFSCSHCYCVENTDCESCQQFLKGEAE